MTSYPISRLVADFNHDGAAVYGTESVLRPAQSLWQRFFGLKKEMRSEISGRYHLKKMSAGLALLIGKRLIFIQKRTP